MPSHFVWAGIISAAALLYYFCNERSRLHRPAAERFFWALFLSCNAAVWLLPTDSPVIQLAISVTGRTPNQVVNNVRGVAILCAAALLGLFRHGRVRRHRLHSSLEQRHFRHQTRAARSTTPETLIGSRAASRLAWLLGRRDDLRWVLRSLSREVWEAATGRPLRVQRSVLEVLQELDGSNLEYLLSSGEVDLPRLLSVAGTPEVVRLLAGGASSTDSVMAKVRLVDAMQRVPDFIFDDRFHQAVTDVFTSAHGRDLQALMVLLDEGGDIFNSHKLVFSDLGEKYRNRVLQHIADDIAQAGTGNRQHRERRILSDIDDTLVSSGGHFPAGASSREAFRRYPKGQIYPGALCLFKELSLPEGEEGRADVGIRARRRDMRSNVAFLSARPHFYKDYTESALYDLFGRLHACEQLHCVPTVLAGHLWSSFFAMAWEAAFHFRRCVGAALAALCLGAVAWLAGHGGPAGAGPRRLLHGQLRQRLGRLERRRQGQGKDSPGVPPAVRRVRHALLRGQRPGGSSVQRDALRPRSRRRGATAGRAGRGLLHPRGRPAGGAADEAGTDGGHGTRVAVQEYILPPDLCGSCSECVHT